MPLRDRPFNSNQKLLAFRWYGGKYSHLDWLLPLLPKTRHFCEPFGGSAAVLLNREPSPIETFNDIDEDVGNFFRVLRDKPEELLWKLYSTPFSYSEFREACELKREKDLPDVERARLFLVRAGQVRIGLAQKATPGLWAWCKLATSRGMSGAVSRWNAKIDKVLPLVVERLRRVQIESRAAIEVMKRYDSKDTLFYCDPPYPHDCRRDPRAYAYEMTAKDHEELAEVLHSLNGKVALSSYRSPLIDSLYKDWNCIEAQERIIHSVKQPRREVLWTNYDLTIEGDRQIQGRLNGLETSGLEKSTRNAQR